MWFITRLILTNSNWKPPCMGKKRACAEITYFLADLGIHIHLTIFDSLNFYHQLRSWFQNQIYWMPLGWKNFSKFGSAVWAFSHYRWFIKLVNLIQMVHLNSICYSYQDGIIHNLHLNDDIWFCQFLSSPSACRRAELLRKEITGRRLLHLSFFRILKLLCYFGTIFLTNFLMNFLMIFFDKFFDKFSIF